jgi:dUTP pyrophosphatase
MRDFVFLVRNYIQMAKENVIAQMVKNLAAPIATYIVTNLAEYLAFIPLSINVKVKRLDPRAKLPTKAYNNDAGWDVYAIQRIYIEPYQVVVVNTGLALEIPPGWHVQVHTRSSFGKKGIKCHLGIVDSGYRNEIGVIMQNNSLEHYIVETGDKFAQLLFLPVPIVSLTETDTLSDTDRGLNGYGSSGK